MRESKEAHSVGFFGLTTGATMQALIDKHLAAPSDKTLARILAYANKHPFSTLMVTADAARFLKSIGV
tara:strand:- start:551 stop:754 length:204 start_codon:yes stop_codon:yes gene_type:complete